MERGSRILIAAAAPLIALPVGWYFGSPWWTLWRMRAAARAGDATTLATYVDFDAVRTDAKAQARAELGSIFGTARAERPLEGALIGLTERKVTDRAVNALISPEALRVWLANMSAPGGKSGAAYAPTVVHRGLNAFEIHDAHRPVHDARLTFHRDGLGWKLAAVRWEKQ